MKETVTIIAALLLLTTLAAKKGLTAPVRGRISSKFGKRGTGWHNGIDIAVPVGTNVKAPADGRVLKVWTSENGGRQLLVQHDNGYISGYAHLSKRLFGTGARVKKGKVIAVTGNTGRVTGAHLHFTWRKNSQYKNPANHFRF